MNVLDLFSGIGGFSLGLERAGMRTVAFCEIDPYCRRVLARHWPDVPVYDDIRTLTAKALGNPNGASENAYAAQGSPRHSTSQSSCGIDVICGGFPCQDISVAGKGAGITGERSGLWKEYARIIGEVRPRYVIVENVAALLGRGLGDVLGDLATLGYDAEWHCIRAADVGAPHRRDRVWIIAYPANDRRQHAAGHSHSKSRTEPRARTTGISGAGEHKDVAYADQPRLERWLRTSLRQCAEQQSAGEGSPHWVGSTWLTEPDVGRVVARVSSRLDGDLDASSAGTREIMWALRDSLSAQAIQWPVGGFGSLQAPKILLSELFEYTGPPKPLGNVSLASATTSQVVMRGVWFDGSTACPSCRRRAAEQRAAEHPDFVRLLSQLLACDCGSTWLDRTGTPSVASRVDRLRSLGNAVVPQIPEIIGRAIMRAQA